MQVRPSTARRPCSSAPNGSRSTPCSRGSLRIRARATVQPQQQQRAQRKRGDQVPLLKRVLTPAEDDIVKLDVGGQTFLTARSTLMQVSGSVLHDMFCTQNSHLLQRSREGAIFLDMDPGVFLLVLQFMRELKMRGGYADHSLSSFRQEDRPHLLLLLQHLRLLPRQLNNTGQLPAGAAAPPPLAPSSQPVPLGPTSSPVNLGSSLQQQGQGGQVQRCRPRADKLEQLAQRSTGQQPQQQQQQQQAQQQQNVYIKERPRLDVLPAKAASGSEGPDAPAAPAGASSRLSKDTSGVQPEPPAASSPPTKPNRQRSPPRLSHPIALPVPRVPATCTSQLYYIQAQSDPQRGMKISVYSEADLGTLPGAEPFDIFCNVTASKAQLSFTFVCRQDFDEVFLGITTRQHIDCRGSLVPRIGWKRGSRVHDGEEPPPPAAGPPLWGRGDSVELLVLLTGRQGPRMVLKVNGRELDSIGNLPPMHAWSWYVALYMAGDMSCVTFMADSYAVFWGEYQVKRFLA